MRKEQSETIFQQQQSSITECRRGWRERFGWRKTNGKNESTIKKAATDDDEDVDDGNDGREGGFSLCVCTVSLKMTCEPEHSYS